MARVATVVALPLATTAFVILLLLRRGPFTVFTGVVSIVVDTFETHSPLEGRPYQRKNYPRPSTCEKPLFRGLHILDKPGYAYSDSVVSYYPNNIAI
jgi:hypothetical protein